MSGFGVHFSMRLVTGWTPHNRPKSHTLGWPLGYLILCLTWLRKDPLYINIFQRVPKANQVLLTHYIPKDPSTQLGILVVAIVVRGLG